MTNYRFKLEDGRFLSYALYGSSKAIPVLYFHGTPSSRLEPLVLEAYDLNLNELLAEAQVQLIAIDRPGMGDSTFNPKGNFISFAADVNELTAALGFKRLPVLCWSGGGPYALAIAFKYPQLISTVSIICGFTRPFGKDVLQQMGMNKWYFHLAHHTPLLLQGAMNVLRHKTIRSVPPQWITGVPYADYALMKDVRHFAALADCTMKEAACHGARGPVHDARSYYHPFGFPLAAIKQPIHYWWGTEDMSVIRLHAESIEQGASNAIMHYREGEGHLSLYVNHFREVLKVLVDSSRNS